MQVIEEDSQFLMRKILGVQTEENCENDIRGSKENCGSRKGHSTCSVLLEKRSTLDLAKISEKALVLTMSYL